MKSVICPIFHLILPYTFPFIPTRVKLNNVQISTAARGHQPFNLIMQRSTKFETATWAVNLRSTKIETATWAVNLRSTKIETATWAVNLRK